MADIVHELDIAAPPDRVFEAVTTQEGLASWWTTDVSTTGTLGSEAVFGFEGHTQEMRMRIEALEPPELVQWTCLHGPDEWVDTTIAFRIEPGAVGTSSVVRLWHGDWEYEDGIMPRVSFRWAIALESLRLYLETGTGDPAR
ncbi:MAG: SRPBCC domain-containing protein [Acidimicrobiales bacterium]